MTPGTPPTSTLEGSPGTAPISATPKLTKACMQCHERKLKCDAPVVGLPCSRCIHKGQPGACAQAARQRRRRPIPKAQQGSSSVLEFRNGLRSRDGPHGYSTRTRRRGAVPQPVALPPAPGSGVEVVGEGDAYVRVCREMAMGEGVLSPDNILDATSPGRDLVEYHNGVNYLSILGEVLSRDRRRRLTRIIVDDKPTNTAAINPTRPQHANAGGAELSGLDSVDREYLAKKGVFSFPKRDCIDSLLKAYFEFVHPYAPVFNRVEFMHSYQSGQYSAFLMQAVLAIAALYVPTEVLLACGFNDRSTAQASFYSKAALLYDFRCERSQLRMLQGSFILSSTVFSYSLDKDFRYWFFNAVRIAIKMGLHKSDIVYDMDPMTYKLCKRIWWVIYSRDVLLSFMGHQNMRMLTNNACDTPAITESDWDDEAAFSQYDPILPAITREEKLYFVANSHLAVIASRSLSALRDERATLLDDLPRAFEAWRQSLPSVLRPRQTWQQDGGPIWYSLLIATSYRFECMLFRLLRSRWQGRDQERHAWAKKHLCTALFELDTMIKRVVANGTMSKFPLAFKTSVPAVLALYIELALDDSEPELGRSMARLQIAQGMLLLKQLHEFPTIRRALAAFEWVLDQKDLTAPTVNPPMMQKATRPHATTGVDAGGADIERVTNAARAQDSMALDSAGVEDMPAEPGQWFEEFLGFDFLENLDLTTL